MADLQDPTSQDFSQQQTDDQPEETAADFFSPQVRYAGPDVVCSSCEYYSNGQCSNQKKIADGGPQVDPGGRCEEFDPANDNDGDELSNALAATKPFGAGQQVSNS